ncbi:unnamed protein product [Mytilus coruscus]|uniref:UMOD/GP2/OIT3-like D8C domain-containing protein n=1 Tax=Mytilus coruscus TaxID=42192 RepID=A0A6J8E8X1_MYTCO|nr:unnamed protein product [Mytilus coruscus]
MNLKKYVCRLVKFFTFVSGQNDPCTTQEILHKSMYRGENCTLKTQKPICDALIQSTWYRIQGDAEILTHGPGMQKCGTLFPIWMNGTLPLIEDGIVNRTACQTGIQTDCDAYFDIKVKRCSTFYVYHLHYPLSTTCTSGFCFGLQECPPEEPCDFYYHDELPQEDIRSLDCPTYSSTKYCDTSLEHAWYKLSTGGKLTNICPGQKTCGSEKPIWINGDIPSITDNILEQNACVPNSTNCCGNTMPIKVKNCSDFLVYMLSPSRDCTERYCIGSGDSVACQTPDSSYSTASTTGNALVSAARLPVALIQVKQNDNKQNRNNVGEDAERKHGKFSIPNIVTRNRASMAVRERRFPMAVRERRFPMAVRERRFPMAVRERRFPMAVRERRFPMAVRERRFPMAISSSGKRRMKRKPMIGTWWL